MPRAVSNTIPRRTFVGAVAATLAAASALFASPPKAVAKSGPPRVSEQDPNAKALGYVHDARNADAARFPKVATPAGRKQNCANCRLYAQTTGDEWAPCALFPGKAVNARGWCAAWVKRG